MNIKAIAEREAYYNGFDERDLYVWLTSTGMGTIPEEWDDDDER